MREIEFRVYHKKKRRMFLVETIGYLTYGIDDVSITLVKKGFNKDGTRPYQAEIDCHVSDVYLMQYIGIKDKNNKKIFEGDIIRHSNGKINQVVYDEGSISFQTGVSDYVVDQEIGIDGKEMEVIGNIYQNKKLLNNENSK